MPDEQTPGSETEPQNGGTDETSEEEPFDAERARATIQKLRGFERDAKAKEREVTRLQAALKEHETAKLSETERLQARVKDLETEREQWQRERRDIETRHAAQAAAHKAGAKYPDAIVRLLDPEAVEYGADGTPRNLDHLLSALKREYPDLFRPPNGSADGGAGGRQDHGTDMNQLIRQAAGRG